MLPLTSLKNNSILKIKINRRSGAFFHFIIGGWGGGRVGCAWGVVVDSCTTLFTNVRTTCTCSAFAQRPASEHQGADDDEIRHRESPGEILARTTQELEELRSENKKLRRRFHPADGQVRTYVRKMMCT